MAKLNVKLRLPMLLVFVMHLSSAYSNLELLRMLCMEQSPWRVVRHV